MNRKRRPRKATRRGAVTVEFAVIAPVFLIVTLGMVEVSRLIEVQDLLASAAREGARLAAMDRNGLDMQNQTTNQKIEQDVRNFLTTSGLPGDKAIVSITQADDPEKTFDIDDPDNNLKLFQLTVDMPYTEINGLGRVQGAETFMLRGQVVFRNARSSLIQ